MTRPSVGAAAVLLALPLSKMAVAQTIALAEEDATVWAQEQVAEGTVQGASAGTLHVNGELVSISATAEGAFSIPIRLAAGETTVVACVSGAAGEVCPDTLRWTLGYESRPEAELRATVEGAAIRLEGHVLENPTGGALSFLWREDPENPAPIGLSVSTDSTASATVPEGALPGEYYVDWTVRADGGAERRARTFVTVAPDGSVTAFDIESDHAAWVDRAMIYEISPYYFFRYAPRKFEAIREKLPEIAELGVNTIWLQPVYGTAGGGQAYDVTDYFSVWSSFGTEAELRALVDEAHALGLHVLFDLVPNHTSIEHPYAQDAVAHGERSHYYDFYQRTFDSADYSQHYNSLDRGAMRFVYYFWEDLVNLNYDNPEVRRHLIEAGRHWVETFDIDGYRIDAAWGVNARNPEFMREWRLALKRSKPELLLLGEDKATRPASFDGRFDVAYDWYPEESWVSHWTWQTDFSESSNPTIFNAASESTRSRRLRDALTNRGEGWAPGAKVLRFMENNDTFRFIATHDLERTKMAAALLFSLPGVPLLYNGQEVGYRTHPYSTSSIFSAGTIRSRDTQGLFPYYQHLLRVRDQFSALTSDTFAEVSVAPASVAGQTFAYRRWTTDEEVVGVINMGKDDVTAELALPVGEMGLDPGTTYYLTNLVTGETHSATGGDLADYTVGVPGYTAHLFAVAESPVEIPVADEPSASAEGSPFVLEPNYPNPFSTTTTIAFQTQRPGPVRLRVFDALGREVGRLVDDVVPAGRHTVTFSGAGIPSGVYVYRLEADGEAASRRMVHAR